MKQKEVKKFLKQHTAVKKKGGTILLVVAGSGLILYGLSLAVMPAVIPASVVLIKFIPAMGMHVALVPHAMAGLIASIDSHLIISVASLGVVF